MDKINNNQSSVDFNGKQLSLILNGLDHHIYITDPDTYEILFINDYLRRNRGEVKGQRCYEAFQGLNYPCPFCTNKFIFGENLGKTYIWDFQNKVDKRWYHCIDRAITWLGGKTVRCEIAIDITEQKRLENELAYVNQQLFSVVDAIGEGMLVIDCDFNIIDVNSALIELLSLTDKASIIGKKCHDILNNFKEFCSACVVKEVYETNKYAYRIFSFTNNGIKSGMEIACYPIKDENKKITGASLFFRNITAKNGDKKEFRIKDFAVTSFFNAIAVFDLDTNLIYANRTLLEMWGYDNKEEVIGKSALGFVKDKEFVSKIVEKIIREGRWMGELIGRRKDDSFFRFQTCVNTIKNNSGLPMYIVASFEDIQHRMIDYKLKESEERFRLLFERIFEAVLVLDMKGNIVKTNTSACELFGYSEEEFVNLSFNDIVSPADNSGRLFREIKNNLGKRHDYVEEMKFKSKTGKIIKVDAACSVLTVNQESYILTSFRDVTRCKEVERKLTESEMRYRNVVEDQTELICRWKPGGILTFVNGAYCRFFGKSQEELLGFNFLNFVDKKDRPAVKKYLSTFNIKNPIKMFEHRVVKPDGGISWHRWIDRAIFDDRGKIIEFQSVGTDITESKETALALQEEKEKAQKYLNVAGVILVALDNKGVVTLINKKGREILGYKEEEIIGKNWFKTFVPKRLQKDVLSVYRKLLAGKVKDYEYYENPVLTKSGAERIIAWHNIIIRDNGKANSTLSSGEDITDRKKTEMELFQVQKLASIGELAAGIAHEVNNPLAALSGEIQWLQGNSGYNKEFYKSLTFMEKICARIDRIITNLLAFSREVSIGQKEWADVNALIDRTLLLIERRLQFSNIKIIKKFDNDIPAIFLRKGEIEQVFLNILTNSMEAMFKGGKITLATSFNKGKKVIGIMFTDNGEGIARENLPKVFDPFFTTKPVGKGTGLGLSISHGIVKRHGGNIEIESKQGKGTRVIINLPYKKADFRKFKAQQKREIFLK